MFEIFQNTQTGFFFVLKTCFDKKAIKSLIENSRCIVFGIEIVNKSSSDIGSRMCFHLQRIIFYFSNIDISSLICSRQNELPTQPLPFI